MANKDFEEGELVEIIQPCCGTKKGELYNLILYKDALWTGKNPRSSGLGCSCGNYWKHVNKPKVNQGKGGSDIMNSVIAKLFEKTADAVLVEKYLGEHIGKTPIDRILLEGKQVELLAETKKLEAEAKKVK